jgi:hypothetical protein
MRNFSVEKVAEILLLEFSKNAESKRSINRRKFAQSCHPGFELLLHHHHHHRRRRHPQQQQQQRSNLKEKI